MNAAPKLSRIILSSPWFLLVFLAIPIMVILNLTLHAGLPFLSPRLLLGNNILFTVLVACRFLWYLSRLRLGIRYGESVQRPGDGFDCRPLPEARSILTESGYTFASGGRYCEKRDLGYLGTVILYAGLLILLATGSWDNLQQFAGVLLDGVGPATKLSKVESYRSISKGPLAGKIDSLPQLRILSQVLPDSTYPKGATEIALIPEHGAPQTTFLIPSATPYRYGAYDISMTKIAYEAQLVIKTKGGQTLLDSLVKLDPLVQKRGDFSFYGLFVGAGIVGGAYYQPEKSLMMVVITRNGKREVADMTFQVDQQVATGDYILSCSKMGQWSEIHVVHRRHKALLFLGGLIALLGLAMRIAIRPERVWLEETDDGCRATALGKDVPALIGKQI
jgi:hypothetical protein